MFVRKKRGTASRKTKRGDPHAVGSAEVAGGPPTPRTPSHTCRARKTPGDPLRLPSVWPHRRPLACPVSSCPPSPNWRRRPGAHKSRHPSCRPGSHGAEGGRRASSRPGAADPGRGFRAAPVSDLDGSAHARPGQACHQAEVSARSPGRHQIGARAVSDGISVAFVLFLISLCVKIERDNKLN